MNVNALTGSSYTNSGASVGKGKGSDATQTFLTLLMTQLKTQDPLSPMDPTQMVTQLAQFDSLSELTQIRQLLQSQAAVSAAATANNAQPNAGGK